MKKITTFVLLALSFSAFSQTDSTFNRHSISLFFGRATATGSYGDDSGYNIDAGFAKSGLAWGINYHFKLHTIFAATVEYASISHDYNSESYTQLLNNETSSMGIRSTVSADPYSYEYIAFGVKGMFGKRLKGYINPQFGFSALTSPEIIVTSTNNVGSLTQKIRETDPQSSGMFGIGFGGIYKLSRVLSLSIDFDYLQSKHEFEVELETFDVNGTPIVDVIPEDIGFRSFNTAFGLNLIF